MTTAPETKLLDGSTLPSVGFGTWPMDDATAFSAVTTALQLGYRLIDTAARYGNETGVGKALTASDVPREDVVVTTKLRGSQHGYQSALSGFEESRRRLGLDQVDLYLIHWPLPGRDQFVDAWRALIHLRDEGMVRSIGVSNFTPAQIDRLVAETGEWPAVNQIELHPDFAQPGLCSWLAHHGIAAQAWSPLGQGTTLLVDPVVTRLARAHERSPAQIVLRWHVQRGDIAIPKSTSPQRMGENLHVFDFELSDADMAALAQLDRGNRLGGDPDTYVEL
jgi:2,5-diketo-D-gluconate reductase A